MQRQPGDRLGPYEIVSAIGKGGMGEVWKDSDTRLHRDVAIKFCANQFSDRFLREARAIAALNHPNICTLHDIGPDYLVMEYIEGTPPRRPLDPPEAVKLALGIAAALEAAHGKGITHRDLKAANVLVTRSGAKLLDFGLALVNDNAGFDMADAPTALSVAGAVTGTAAYSPDGASSALLRFSRRRTGLARGGTGRKPSAHLDGPAREGPERLRATGKRPVDRAVAGRVPRCGPRRCR